MDVNVPTQPLKTLMRRGGMVVCFKPGVHQPGISLKQFRVVMRDLAENKQQPRLLRCFGLHQGKETVQGTPRTAGICELLKVRDLEFWCHREPFSPAAAIGSLPCGREVTPNRSFIGSGESHQPRRAFRKKITDTSTGTQIRKHANLNISTQWAKVKRQRFSYPLNKNKYSLY
jgi:hypothetical protein